MDLMSAQRVYLDHAATTPVRSEVREAMLPYLSEQFGNPSSLHEEGTLAREAIESARESIRRACSAPRHDLVFTSGGTESNNGALLGAVLAARSRGAARPHVVTTAVEHSSVLDAMSFIEAIGGCADIVGVDGEGRVDPGRIREAITPETAIVSVQAANNEVGTLQPVREIARETRRRGVPLHVDAVQLLGKMPLRVDELGADLVTISAHKVEGPKGVAGLFISKAMRIERWMRGGGQERGLRGGTENVVGIIGFARAVDLAAADLERGAMSAAEKLRDAIRSAIEDLFPDARVNTPASGALPTILSVSFPGIEGESLVKLLDLLGVSVSTGSACNAGARKPSHVLESMGRSAREIRGSLRASLGRTSTEEEAGLFIERLREAVERLSALAPPVVGITGNPYQGG